MSCRGVPCEDDVRRTRRLHCFPGPGAARGLRLRRGVRGDALEDAKTLDAATVYGIKVYVSDTLKQGKLEIVSQTPFVI